MSKTVKIVLLILGLGIVGVLIWYFFVYKKSGSVVDANGNPLTPPPLATPPINGANVAGSPTDPNSGLGLAAINQRMNEILGSSAWLDVQSKVQQDLNIMTGVSPAQVEWYSVNIARPPITSTKAIPLKLSATAKAALKSFAYIPQNNPSETAGYAATTSLRGANREMMNSIGTAFVGNIELDSQQGFNQQVICQRYENCGGNYQQTGAKVAAGSNKAAGDMAKMAAAWLAGAETFDHAVKDRAIQDLRNVGWKFIGFDF